MTDSFTPAELEAYLDEALPAPAMAAVEDALRRQPELGRQLMAIHARRDQGLHSLGEIWRRHRLSCPDRQELGSYLLDVLEVDRAQYIAFHLETIGCRHCQANIDDLRRQQAETAEILKTRQRKFFQSSAGLLRGKAAP